MKNADKIDTKNIDEVTRFDSAQRAKSTIEYEQMLMTFIGNELSCMNGDVNGRA